MMNRMDVDQVLAQMRVMTAQAKAEARPQEAPGEQGSFVDVLKQSIDAVSQTQQKASAMAKDFETGQGDASLAEVMVAMQKSSLSFDAMVQVRNKLVEAYKDIMNMPM